MSRTPDLSQAVFRYVRCIDCDAAVKLYQPTADEQAQCPRCRHTLSRGSRWSLKRCSLIALSILILMPFALTYPLLSIHLLGMNVDASVWQGIWKMSVAGYPYTGFMVFICAVLMPISFAILIILLRLAQIMHIKPRNVLLFVGYIQPWVMFDVYLVALGVAMFKVREYAALEVDIYLIAFVFVAILTTLLFTKINLDELWNDFYPERQPITQANQSLKLCHACHYSFVDGQEIYDMAHHPLCPRCQSRLDISDKIKLQNTWALLITGIIMLLPANLLPISGVVLTGALSESTLMGGVISFVQMGSYFVAFVVFFASIFVPITKVIIMLYLLLSVHFQWAHSIKWHMRLYHFVHFIGRWSMLDLFVIALMMSLVNRGQIIEFTVGSAAFYFGAAVFSTMFATEQFDSRLLWKIYDRKEK